MRKFMASIRGKLLAGLVVTVPAVATILALRFLLRNLDSLLGPWIGTLIGRSVPGLGVVATFLLVLIAGVVATNYLGRRLIAVVERAFTGLPPVRRVYSASKDIVESATLSQRSVLRQVVMFEYPRVGVYSYGFVTSYATRHAPEGPQRLANVFIPGPPVPSSGNLVAVPIKDLVFLDMTIDEALKLILSLGMASPHDLRGSVGGAPSEGGETASPVP